MVITRQSCCDAFPALSTQATGLVLEWHQQAVASAEGRDMLEIASVIRDQHNRAVAIYGVPGAGEVPLPMFAGRRLSLQRETRLGLGPRGKLNLGNGE